MNAETVRSAFHICTIFAFYLATAMLVPALLDLSYNNPDWRVFALSSVTIAIPSALIAVATRGAIPTMTTRFTFLVVNMLWLTFALVGAVPLLESSIDLSFADAFFESMSAITTTGSTVLSNLDSTAPGILLWRSMLQWFGGLGVIALGLFILPFLKISSSSMFRIESSDRNDKPFARFSTFAQGMIYIYIASTVLCIIAYWAGGMSFFDAINHAFTTLSTGGFSTHDASFGYFDSTFLKWAAIVFMLVGAIPFTALILLLVRRRLDVFQDNQIFVMLSYTAFLAIGMALYLHFNNIIDFRHGITEATFNIVSMITTTGYATTDYLRWGQLAVAIALIATVLGGCSGSTAGGIKTYRWMIGFAMIRKSLETFIYPHAIRSVRTGANNVGADLQTVTLLFFTAYVFIVGTGTLLLSLSGADIITAFSGTLTALGNVGPGLSEQIGPSGNFASLSDAAKWILSFLMLLGRLEIFTVLVILTPAFWRE